MKKISLSSTAKIVLSFFLLILVGSIVLSLPVSNRVTPQPFLNNLFVATSCVCVTGLTPFVIVEQYNVFGQIVMMLLIQLGGLGLITFLYFFLHAFRWKLSLNTKLVFTEALNQSDLAKLPRLLRTIFLYTGSVEGIGALLLTFVFAPKYGAVKGIYYAIWHSISAFCNAGFDLLGSNSLMGYRYHVAMNLIMMALIVLGGLGFMVVLDIHDKQKKQKTWDMKRLLKHLSLHSKIVLLLTASLLVSGTVILLALEYTNPATIGQDSFGNKLLISLFQSVTLRTAGFATVPIVSFRNASKLLMCIYMFIGGSPASTAGGIKTVTFALVLLTIFNVFKGNEETYVFNRRIKKRIFLRAFALFSIGIALCLTGVVLLSITDGEIPFIDVFVEIFSAFGTVGLSADVTPVLSDGGKVIDIILMFIGRISPMSLSIVFAKKAHRASAITYADEDVIIG